MLKTLFGDVIFGTEFVPETKTKFGIIVPDSPSKDIPYKIKVTHVGPDVKGIKEGDVVLFKRHAIEKLEVGTSMKKDELYYSFSEYVLAVLS